MRIALAALTAFAVLAVLAVLAPPTNAARPITCKKSTINGVLTAEGKDKGVGIAKVECIDITGDGKRDALFTVLSGGTAGTTHFGVIAGPGGVLVHYEDGYKVGVDAVSDTRFDVQQPIYKKDDANCCPSSFAVTPYRWTGTKFKAGKSTSHKKPSKRFF